MRPSPRELAQLSVMDKSLNGATLVSKPVMQLNLRCNRDIKLPSIARAMEATQSSLASYRPALDVIDLADPDFKQAMHRAMASKRSQHRNASILEQDSSQESQDSHYRSKESLFHLDGSAIAPVRFGSKSLAGIARSGEPAENQDRVKSVENFLGETQLHFVADGHGPCGLDVVSLVHVDFPFLLQPLLVKARQALDADKILVEEAPEQPQTRWEHRKLTQKLYKEALKAAFEEMHKKVMLQKFKFNIAQSGAALSAVLVDEDWLFCAGVGNAKVVLLQLDRAWQAKKEAEVDPVQVQELTVRHWPQDPREAQRVKKAGGEVRPGRAAVPKSRADGTFQMPQDRVWLPGKEQPGLAITRSIGDELAHQIGVIAEPGKEGGSDRV